MSPDEITTLLDWIADELALAVFNPVTHVPMTGEQVAFELIAILRRAATGVNG